MLFRDHWMSLPNAQIQNMTAALIRFQPSASAPKWISPCLLVTCRQLSNPQLPTQLLEHSICQKFAAGFCEIQYHDLSTFSLSNVKLTSLPNQLFHDGIVNRERSRQMELTSLCLTLSSRATFWGGETLWTLHHSLHTFSDFPLKNSQDLTCVKSKKSM